MDWCCILGESGSCGWIGEDDSVGDGLIQAGGKQLECFSGGGWGVSFVEAGDPVPDDLGCEVAELLVAEVLDNVPVDVNAVSGFS